MQKSGFLTSRLILLSNEVLQLSSSNAVGHLICGWIIEHGYRKMLHMSLPLWGQLKELYTGPLHIVYQHWKEEKSEPEVRKFSKLNSAEHEIYFVYKC